MREKLAASLNGLLCAYKPADLSVLALKKNIVKGIVTQGNAAVGWPPVKEITVCSDSRN